MADKKSGGASKGGKGFSSPAMQAVWIETIHKELRNQKMNTNFHFNPKAFPIITDKVTKSFKEPMDLNTASAAEIVELEKDLRLEDSLRESMQSTDKPPSDKYEFPLTDAQEIGWYCKPEFVTKNAWHRGRNSCEVTQYANTYVTCMGKSPFAGKSAFPKSAAKK